MGFSSKEAVVAPNRERRFLPPSVVAGFRVRWFHPVAVIRRASRSLARLVMRRIHAALLNAAGLPDQHGSRG
jgi:hypothetical protein